jgi:hypothetical protein
VRQKEGGAQTREESLRKERKPIDETSRVEGPSQSAGMNQSDGLNQSEETSQNGGMSQSGGLNRNLHELSALINPTEVKGLNDRIGH